MAEVEYGDRYSVEQEILKDAEQRRRYAITDAVGLASTKGAGMMYHAVGEGQRQGAGLEGLGNILTGKEKQLDPRLARQDALAAILAPHGRPDSYEDMVAIANDLRAGGFPDEADLAMKQANDYKKMETDRMNAEDPTTLTTKETTMEMAAQFHQCAIDAGGWQKADMKCKTAVKKTFIAMQRQTADEAGNIEAAKQGAEAIQTAQTKIYLDSDAAADSIASIQQSIELLPGLYLGTAGEGIKNFKTLLVSLGIIDEGRSIEEAQFMRNSMKAVTDWIALTKGAISDKEMDAFVAASPGLQTTRAGNLLILETMKAAADYNVRLEAEYNDWKTKADKRARASGIPVSEVEWRNHKAHWYRTGGKVKLPTVAQIKAALLPGSDEVETTSDFTVTID